MLQALFMAMSEMFQCFMVLAVAILGFYVYSKKPGWCDRSLGRLSKGKCDNTKRIISAALSALLSLSLIRTLMMFMGGGGFMR